MMATAIMAKMAPEAPIKYPVQNSRANNPRATTAPR
jgi:hypothetical protein